MRAASGASCPEWEDSDEWAISGVAAVARRIVMPVSSRASRPMASVAALVAIEMATDETVRTLLEGRVASPHEQDPSVPDENQVKGRYDSDALCRSHRRLPIASGLLEAHYGRRP